MIGWGDDEGGHAMGRIAGLALGLFLVAVWGLVVLALIGTALETRDFERQGISFDDGVITGRTR